MADRETRFHDEDHGDTLQRALIGGVAVAAAAGAAFFIGSALRNRRDEPMTSDAPPWTMKGKSTGPDGKTRVGHTVTIGKPKQEIYAFWRDFPNLARVMENVERIDPIDRDRSHWVVKAPGGRTVEWDSIVTEDKPDRLIAWRTEGDGDIQSTGRIEFLDASPGRGTMVRAVIDYDPPGGTAGQWLAKLLQREPNVQMRRDMRRLKQFLETGEVTSSAGPSGRKWESPTKQYL